MDGRVSRSVGVPFEQLFRFLLIASDVTNRRFRTERRREQPPRKLRRIQADRHRAPPIAGPGRRVLEHADAHLVKNM